jgi:hypothetical protein
VRAVARRRVPRPAMRSRDRSKLPGDGRRFSSLARLG